MVGKAGKLGLFVVIGTAVAGTIYFGRGGFHSAVTIHELLGENKQLKEAISNLTTEDQIGYAKVISQERREGKLFTTLKFVETARDDKLRKVLEKEYTVEGDVVYFDALIVKFGDKFVTDGRGRALYLWRRIYGENSSPEQGLAIEEMGAEPERYGGILKLLPGEQRGLFWRNIWELANNPEALAKHDIAAIYGNAVYQSLRPGLIYVFRITPTGQLYPETVPDM